MQTTSLMHIKEKITAEEKNAIFHVDTIELLSYHVQVWMLLYGLDLQIYLIMRWGRQKGKTTFKHYT